MFAVVTSCFLVFLFSTLVLAVSSTTTTFYVSPTGHDSTTFNCSYDHPCQTIQFVVTLTSPGDSIFLYNGTFTYDNPIFIANTTLNIIALLTNESIIDCNGTSSGFILSNVSFFLQGVQINNCIIDKTFWNNYYYALDSVGGAAILALNASALHLQNCSFWNNTATAFDAGQGQDSQGGAVFAWNSPQVTIIGCSFVQNGVFGNADVGGGAITLWSVPTVKMSWTTFQQNVAKGSSDSYTTTYPAGGALSVSNFVDMTLEHCDFVANSAMASTQGEDYATEAVGGFAAGGAINVQFNGWTTPMNTQIQIAECNFVANFASAGNGSNVGGQASGGALSYVLVPLTVMTITGGSWVGNYAVGGFGEYNGGGGGAIGGALAMGPGSNGTDPSNITIHAARFFNNSVAGGAGFGIAGAAEGAGVYLVTTSVIIENCTFVGNNAAGGSSSGDSGGQALGGGALIAAVHVNLTDCTFIENNVTGGDANIESQGPGGQAGGASLEVASTSGDYGNYSSWIRINGCTFQANQAVGGASLLNNQGAAATADVTLAWANMALTSPTVNHSIEITQSVFHNSTTRGGMGYGGGLGLGGALAITDFYPGIVGLVSMSNCTFTGTHTFGGVGGLNSGGLGGIGGNALGGAVYIDDTVINAVFVACTFLDCTAEGGIGGNATVTLNLPLVAGQGGSAQGGAVYSTISQGMLTVAHCLFIDNHAIGGAGGWSSATYPPAMFHGGAAIGGAVQAQYVAVSYSGFFNNSALTSDQASSEPAPAGGGALSSFNILELSNHSWFVKNQVTSFGSARGGAVLLANISTICSTTFTANSVYGTAESLGGAAATPVAQAGVLQIAAFFDVAFFTNTALNAGNSYTSFGGGLFFNSSETSITLMNCTWIENTAQFGGGMFLSSLSNSSTLFNLMFEHNNASIGGGAAFFDAAQVTNAICNISLDDSNSQAYGGPISSTPWNLEWTLSPDDCTVWPNSHFQVSLKLIDICNNSMRLENVLLLSNASSSDPFSSDVPLGLVPFTMNGTSPIYSFYHMKVNATASTTMGELSFVSQLRNGISSAINVTQSKSTILRIGSCPPGYMNKPEGTCTQCTFAAGYYSLSGKEECRLCPTGAMCMQQPAGDSTRHILSILPGFWFDPNSTTILQCPKGKESCLGFTCSFHPVNEVSCPVNIKNEMERKRQPDSVTKNDLFWKVNYSSCAVHKSCQTGYTARLCSRCACETNATSTCYFMTASGDCQQCKKPHLRFDVLIAIAVVFLAALSVVILLRRFGLILIIVEIPILIVLLIIGKTDIWVFDLFLLLGVVYLITNRSIPSGAAQSFIFYLQAMTMLIGGLPWLEWIRSLIGYIRFANFQVSGLECLNPLLTTPIGGFLVYMLTPLILAFLVVVIMYFGRTVQRLVRLVFSQVIRRNEYKWKLSIQQMESDHNDDDQDTSYGTTEETRQTTLLFLSDEDDVFMYDRDENGDDNRSHTQIQLTNRISAAEKDHGNAEDLGSLIGTDAVVKGDDDESAKNEKDDQIIYQPQVRHRATSSRSSLSFFEKVLHAILFLLYVSYFDLARVILALFRPCWVGYMAQYPWIPCDFSNSQYSLLFSLAVVFCVIYVLGLLVLFAGLLYYFRQAILSHSAGWMSFFTQAFREPVYWFEWVLMVRRLALAVAIAVIPAQNVLQPAIVLTVLLMSLVAQLAVKPFKRQVENTLEVSSLVTLLLTYATSLAFQTATQDVAGEQVVRIVLFAQNASMVGAFLVVLFHAQVMRLLIWGSKQVKRVLYV